MAQLGSVWGSHKFEIKVLEALVKNRFQVHAGYWQSTVPWGCRSEFLVSFWAVSQRQPSAPRNHLHFFSCGPFRFHRQQGHMNSFSHWISLTSSLLLAGENSLLLKGSCVYIRPTQIISPLINLKSVDWLP